MRKAISSGLDLRFPVKDILIKRLVLVCDDCRADGIAGDVYGGSGHIKIRSIPMISPIASTGRPTELNTIVKVTSPTLGTPAVPMEARVAVPMTIR